jgi:hypothetical protein
MRKLLAILAGAAMMSCSSAASIYTPKDIQHNLVDNYKLESFGMLPFGISYKTYILQTNKSKVRCIYTIDGVSHAIDFDHSKNIAVKDGKILHDNLPSFNMLMNNSMMIRKPGESYQGGIVK